jgi:transcriptional regulator with XRE-family HTH domain
MDRKGNEFRSVVSEVQDLATAFEGMLHEEDSDPGTAPPEARRKSYEAWEKDFGDKVRQWRHALNWSQEDVAQRMRVRGFEMHQTTVAKIERGTRPLRVAEAVALASIFDMPTLAVFRGEGPKQPGWPEKLTKLQQEMERAEQALEHAMELLNKSGELYAIAHSDLHRLSKLINEATAEHLKERQDRGSEA